MLSQAQLCQRHVAEPAGQWKEGFSKSHVLFSLPRIVFLGPKQLVSAAYAYKAYARCTAKKFQKDF